MLMPRSETSTVVRPLSGSTNESVAYFLSSGSSSPQPWSPLEKPEVNANSSENSFLLRLSMYISGHLFVCYLPSLRLSKSFGASSGLDARGSSRERALGITKALKLGDNAARKNK